MFFRKKRSVMEVPIACMTKASSIEHSDEFPVMTNSSQTYPCYRSLALFFEKCLSWIMALFFLLFFFVNVFARCCKSIITKRSNVTLAKLDSFFIFDYLQKKIRSNSHQLKTRIICVHHNNADLMFFCTNFNIPTSVSAYVNDSCT